MGLLKRLFVFLLIVFLLALLAVYWPNLTGNAVDNQEQTDYQKEPTFLTRVIDGDTVEIETGERIRLLGINTPEKKMPYSNEAIDFLKKIENKDIDLLRDSEDKDRYERKLRYVFYGNRFINLEILEQGLATSFMTNGLEYEEKMKKAEDSARINKIGLWKESRDVCAYCIKLIELNYTNEFFIIRNDCDFKCNLSGWFVKDDANHFFYLDKLNNGELKKYESGKEIWNNAGDRFFMRDSKGGLVVFYEYPLNKL